MYVCYLFHNVYCIVYMNQLNEISGYGIVKETEMKYMSLYMILLLDLYYDMSIVFKCINGMSIWLHLYTDFKNKI